MHIEFSSELRFKENVFQSLQGPLRNATAHLSISLHAPHTAPVSLTVLQYLKVLLLAFLGLCPNCSPVLDHQHFTRHYPDFTRLPSVPLSDLSAKENFPGNPVSDPVTDILPILSNLFMHYYIIHYI